jgi:hypothetical protein
MLLVVSQTETSTSNSDVIGQVIHAARKADWDELIVKADRASSWAGAAALIAALLYFAPIIFRIVAN